MPATRRRKRSIPHAGRCVLGVDGCRAGWAAVRINLYDNDVSGFMAEAFTDILAVEDVDMIMVDMPIGLADAGARACEAMARKRLSPLRHSSVFSPPRRKMLSFSRYEDANAWGKENGGKGLSKQAWMIAPKIREIDEAVTPEDQTCIGEAHPEVAFARLNGDKPCAHPKRTAEGQRERRALLMRAGIADAETIYKGLRKQHGAKSIARDDVYDACALALTAKARLDGSAMRLSDDACDARGLVMEIWG